MFVSVRMSESVCECWWALCMCVCACTTPVWRCRGAEVSDCLVSVGSKLWQFALTVNLEEFLMELRSCQNSKCCCTFFSFFFFFFIFSLNPPSTTLFSVSWKKGKTWGGVRVVRQYPLRAPRHDKSSFAFSFAKSLTRWGKSEHVKDPANEVNTSDSASSKVV